MFGFFKKKAPVEETEAYKMGQRAVNGFAEELNTFMQERFDPVFNKLMAVLDDRLEGVYDDPDAPPVTLAKTEYKLFLDNVKDKRSDMQHEIDGAMSEWLSVADQLGIRKGFNGLIAARLDSFYERLTMTGFQVLVDKADRLKPADAAWRERNPELAKQFPEPE